MNAHKDKRVFDNQGPQIADTIAIHVGKARNRNGGKQPLHGKRRSEDEESQGRGQPIWRKEIHIGDTIY